MYASQKRQKAWQPQNEIRMIETGSVCVSNRAGCSTIGVLRETDWSSTTTKAPFLPASLGATERRCGVVWGRVGLVFWSGFDADPSSDSDGILHLQARGDLGLQMNYAFRYQFSSFPTRETLVQNHLTGHTNRIAYTNALSATQQIGVCFGSE